MGCRLTRANDFAVELATWELGNKRRRIGFRREWAVSGWDERKTRRNTHAAQCDFAWGNVMQKGFVAV